VNFSTLKKIFQNPSSIKVRMRVSSMLPSLVIMKYAIEWYWSPRRIGNLQSPDCVRACYDVSFSLSLIWPWISTPFTRKSRQIRYWMTWSCFSFLWSSWAKLFIFRISAESLVKPFDWSTLRRKFFRSINYNHMIRNDDDVRWVILLWFVVDWSPFSSWILPALCSLFIRQVWK